MTLFELRVELRKLALLHRGDRTGSQWVKGFIRGVQMAEALVRIHQKFMSKQAYEWHVNPPRDTRFYLRACNTALNHLTRSNSPRAIEVLRRATRAR